MTDQTATVHVLYWHHIPTQVKARGQDGEVVRLPLPARFQAAVDQARRGARNRA